MMKARAFILAIAAVVSGSLTQAAERVLKLEELAYTDIDRLDRERTVFLLTFGNLEEHGPQLPVGSDYFQAIAFRDGVVQHLSEAHPDHNFVFAPVVPLGEGGANDVVGQLEHVGTFGVRFETLRSVAIDLGSGVARQGFRNIFLIHFHGMPLHSVAFNDAAAYVSDRYKARMVNLTSLVFGEGLYSNAVFEKHLGKGWEERIGFEGHAGAGETAASLAIRPELVKSDYKRLEPFKARDLDEFLRTYQNPAKWRGYWGSPAEASVALGKDLMSEMVSRGVRIAEKALAGEDLPKLPLWPNVLPASAEADALVKRALDSYSMRSDDVQAWLKARDAKK
jgi:creatinine amidohydrolase/Fe(II)-dependent formamide hydrolase-like protein